MKFNTVKEKAIRLFHSQLFWIQVCAVGIWLLVIQNYLGGEDTAQPVYVVGGNINADVQGSVGISGSVDVDNIVDINIKAVNGYRNAFYGPSNNGSYDAIHVYTGR